MNRRYTKPDESKLQNGLLLIVLLLICDTAVAQSGLSAVSVSTSADGGKTYSLSLQILVLMTALTLLPAALMMVTSFTRIIIVLAILRTAIGTTTTPTNQILVGLALFLTIFIMTPVFDRIYEVGLKPYLDDEIQIQEAAVRASVPLKEFMLGQTRNSDLALFYSLSGEKPAKDHESISFTLLVPSFVTSELKTAFQIGFLLFIPFLIIDLVVASVLMSMGMMMLSPLIISLPFKVMLFVLVDGWALVIGTLATSFYV